MPKKESHKDETEPKKRALTRRSTLILIALGITFVALVVSVAFRQISEASFSDGTFGKMAYRLLSQLLFLNFEKIAPKSTATLFIEGETLKVSFNFLPEDNKRAVSLSDNLGIGREWTKGMAVTLDNGTVSRLKQLVPSLGNGEKLTLNVTLSDKSVEFSSPTILPSSNNNILVNSQNVIASGSGQIKVSNLDDGGIKIEINNPAEALTQEENAGTINLSEKLRDNLWQLAQKFTRIELQIEGNTFQGKVYIK